MIEIIIAISSVIFAAITTIFGLYQYHTQIKQKRAEYFIEMRHKLKDTEPFKKICELIFVDGEKLKQVPPQDKRDFLGFLEEVALMLNSGLIDKKVAHYMFGNYAIKCWKSENFWLGPDSKEQIVRSGRYWSLFRNFKDEMEELEKAQDFGSGSADYTSQLKF